MADSSIATQETKEPEFNIFPNPASKYIFVYYRLNKEEDVYLNLFNVNGQSVKTLINQQKQVPGDYNNTFDVSDLPEGIYIARVSSGSLTKSVKLVVLK